MVERAAAMSGNGRPLRNRRILQPVRKTEKTPFWNSAARAPAHHEERLSSGGSPSFHARGAAPETARWDVLKTAVPKKTRVGSSRGKGNRKEKRGEPRRGQ